MTLHPFDLQARAALAVSSLTSLVDPERDGQIYFLADWRAKPPRADHGLWDCGDGSGRHIDALTLARSILPVGCPAGYQDASESHIEAWMMNLLGEDGLSWLPHEPWAAPWGTDLVLADWDPADILAEVSWAQRGTLLGLASRFARTQDERYSLAGKRMVDGLMRIAIAHPDGYYYPEGYYRKGGWHATEPGLYGGIEEYNAAVLVSLVRFYNATGYEKALILAEGLARFALKHTRGYMPDGRLHAGSRPGVEDHLHTRTNFILGVLELGVITGRPEFIAWARQEYAYAKQWGTDFGWFPEGIGHRHGEICCTTDMLECALLLGQHVHHSYYADAERFGRNHLLESQYVSLAALQHAVANLPSSQHQAPYEGRYSTIEHVTESQLGAFAARSTLNDAFHLDATAMMQCCNAAGTRGLYDLWHGAIELAPGEPSQLFIHMRFSTETPAVRVVSAEPAQGMLEITTHHDYLLSVRLPDGEPSALICRAKPEISTAQLDAKDGYVNFQMHAGETVKLYYPLHEHVQTYHVGSADRPLTCTATWRGETVMHMDPHGEYLPLYQRSCELPPVIPTLPQS